MILNAIANGNYDEALEQVTKLQNKIDEINKEIENITENANTVSGKEKQGDKEGTNDNPTEPDATGNTKYDNLKDIIDKLKMQMQNTKIQN